MSSESWPIGYDRLALHRVDSTNAEAARRAVDISGPTWVFAKEQFAARGRRGRAWKTDVQNFGASLILPSLGNEQAALLSFVAALAVLDACREVAGIGASFSLKWPNDVLLNGAKCSGILLEGITVPPDRAFVVIGIGVNLATAPDSSELDAEAMPPTCLFPYTDVSSEDFLAVLAHTFAANYRVFETQGFSPIRDAWLTDAARLGMPIIARTVKGETRGIFETLDISGALVLSTPKGRQLVQAADVYF